MKKLTVEIELTEEELEVFNSFMEYRCIDIGKYLKRLIMGESEKHISFMKRAKAGEAKRTA